MTSKWRIAGIIGSALIMVLFLSATAAYVKANMKSPGNNNDYADTEAKYTYDRDNKNNKNNENNGSTEPLMMPVILPDATAMPTIKEPGSPGPSNDQPATPAPTTTAPPTTARPPATTAPPAETTSPPAAAAAPTTAPPPVVPKEGNGAKIAITFDDGPSAYTDRILEILAENGAKATFCVLGRLVEKNEKTVKNIISQGSQVIGHSWSHSDFRKLSDAQIRGELLYTNDAIFNITGVKPVIYRAPYGAYNANIKKLSKELGMSLLQWNIDTGDWRYRNADTVYKNIVTSVKEGAVILCHDIHATTKEAMERAIPALVEKGWKLVTVEELLGETAPGVVYFSAFTKEE